jgi:hypothetical protein
MGMGMVVNENARKGSVLETVYSKESARALGGAKHNAKTRQRTAPIVFNILGIEVLILTRFLGAGTVAGTLYALVRKSNDSVHRTAALSRLLGANNDDFRTATICSTEERFLFTANLPSLRVRFCRK